MPLMGQSGAGVLKNVSDHFSDGPITCAHGRW
jgi:hypothetical protein